MKCTACGSENLIKQDRKYKEYSFYHCKDCNVMFCFPSVNPGSEWYEDSEIHTLLNNLLANQTFWYHDQFINDAAIYGKNLLDIGCGVGNFLNAVKDKYIIWGIDFNRCSIEIAKQKYGFKNVYPVDIKSFCEQYKVKFDVITFYEVMEHQSNPSLFIDDVKKILEPSGYIALSIPNRSRLLNPLGEADGPPNHFTWWDEKTLGDFLKRKGFDVVKIYSRKLDSEGLADYIELLLRFTFGSFIMRLLKKDGTIIKNTRAIVCVMDRVLRSALKPANLFFNIFSIQGSNLYALAKLK